MLCNVPSAINRLTRNIVINHPNSWRCQIFRKQTQIHNVGKDTIGGLGVLSTEDADDITYEYLGGGYALKAEAFNSSAQLVNNYDANIGEDGKTQYLFLIEPDAIAGESNYFQIKERDIMMLVIHENAENDTMIKLAYEIVGMETTTDIPPFCTRYICNKRSEADIFQIETN